MRSRNLVQVRLSVIVIPDLIREPDENNLKLTTLQHTTGSRIKSGMTGMREPRLDEDTVVINGKYLKEVKPEHPMKNCV